LELLPGTSRQVRPSTRQQTLTSTAAYGQKKLSFLQRHEQKQQQKTQERLNKKEYKKTTKTTTTTKSSIVFSSKNESSPTTKI